MVGFRIPEGTAPGVIKIREEARPWPVRPQPLDGESMTSWFLRLSEANGIVLSDLFQSAPEGKRSSRDPDLFPSQAFLEWISVIASTPLEQLSAMTLGPLADILHPRRVHSRTNDLRWKCTRRGTPRLVKNQFCPLCLQSDPVPYFRLHWRLSFVTVCERHRNPLWDSCPSCKGELDPQNKVLTWAAGGGPEIVFCRACGKDLRHAQVNRISPGEEETRELVESALQHQSLLLDAMKSGFFSKGKRVPIDSRDLFRVLRLVIKEMLSPSHIEGLRRIISREWPNATSLATFCVPGNPGFDQLSTLDRLAIMGITEWDVHGISLRFFKNQECYPLLPRGVYRYWKMRQEDASGWTRANLTRKTKA